MNLKLTKVKYENYGKIINVMVDYESSKVWLSQKDISCLFGKSVKTISRHIANLGQTNSQVILSSENTEQVLKITRSDGKLYNVKHYNLDIVMKVGYKCNPAIASKFKEWVDGLFLNFLVDNKCFNKAINFEVVRFESDGISLDVNVSPTEDTVWLRQVDMAILFDTSIPNISMHINDILGKKELEIDSVIKKILTTASDGKKYNVTYYNLDMVISVGFRVNTKRGIEFRKWSISILKNYLIKGYTINKERCLQHSDILVAITNEINRINDYVKENDVRIGKIEDKINKMDEDYIVKMDRLIFNGKLFEPMTLLSKIVSVANNNIYLIDPYIDIRTLNIFKNKKKEVMIYAITSKKARISNIDIELFNNEYGGFNIFIENEIHDRYLIIDDSIFYHIGSSINYIGKGLSQITEITLDEIKNILLCIINKIINK